MKSIPRLLAVLLFPLFASGPLAQTQPVTKEAKPYKVLTNGRQLTIKSSAIIHHIMLWTTGGDRVVEQKGINNNSYSVTVPISRKTFFLMVGLSNGKVYTEKIGMP